MLRLLPCPSGRSGLWPFDSVDLGAIAVAGTDFAALRAAPFAGFPVPAGVLEHAFVSAEDAARLREQAGPAVLLDANGDELAFTGEGGDPAATRLIASSGSFAVRRPWDLLRVNEIVLGTFSKSLVEGELSPHAHVSGILRLAPGARVLPGVYIEGVVVIGAGCKIGPNCHIRGSTAIGPGCHIGQSVEIKNSVIGRKTNVGHLSYVGDSVLGDNVNFGAGTITSNLRHDGAPVRTPVDGRMEDSGRRKFGVIAGDGARTGINTAIYPGRKIAAGAGTLPASVVARDITA